MIPSKTLEAHSASALDTLHTLTGVSLPLFSKIYRIAALIQQRRGKVGGWSDEGLMDLIQPCGEIEEELREEKLRLDGLVLGKLGGDGL